MKHLIKKIKHLVFLHVMWLLTWAARYIACDCHVHLVSKAVSVISGKSPSPVFRWSGI